MKGLFSRKTLYIVSAFLVALTVAISSLAFVPSPVYAQSPTPSPKDPTARNAVLERAYQREQNWLSVQTTHLQRMNDLAAKAQTLIDKAKAAGKNVDGLENALSVFKTQITNAQGPHDNAASILNAHNGFDASGKVTDPAAARQTILDGRKSLQDAHLIIRQASVDLRAALREWRENHKGEKNATPVPTTGG